MNTTTYIKKIALALLIISTLSGFQHTDDANTNEMVGVYRKEYSSHSIQIKRKLIIQKDSQFYESIKVNNKSGKKIYERAGNWSFKDNMLIFYIRKDDFCDPLWSKFSDSVTST